jgi:hypothetical protein
MRKLTVRQKDGSQRECGCTFTLAGGFVYVCDAHKRVAAGIRASRIAAKPLPRPVVVAVTPQEDPPELVAAIQAECEKRAEILRVERAKINKPSSKLTNGERAHLHTFAFSSVEIRDALRASWKPSKKHTPKKKG